MKLITGSVIMLILAACSSGAAATPLQCPECPLVGVISVIDGDTFESPIGTVDGSISTIRLFGVDPPETGPALLHRGHRVPSGVTGVLVTRVQEGPRLVDGYWRILQYVHTESG